MNIHDLFHGKHDPAETKNMLEVSSVHLMWPQYRFVFVWTEGSAASGHSGRALMAAARLSSSK